MAAAGPSDRERVESAIEALDAAQDHQQHPTVHADVISGDALDAAVQDHLRQGLTLDSFLDGMATSAVVSRRTDRSFCRRSSPARDKMTLDDSGAMQACDRVTVEASVVVFNHPEHRGQAFDMARAVKRRTSSRLEGTGDQPNAPRDRCLRPWRGHFRADELKPAD